MKFKSFPVYPLASPISAVLLGAGSGAGSFVGGHYGALANGHHSGFANATEAMLSGAVMGGLVLLIVWTLTGLLLGALDVADPAETE